MATRKRSTPAPAACKGLLHWLSLNLGRGTLGALTGTDSKALAAAVHILELYNYGGHNERTLEAFRLIVSQMQPSTQVLAYHAIAFLGEWDARPRVWLEAGLEPLDRISVCEGEPAGRRAELDTW